MSESKMYTAEVIADSISPEGHRITTVKVIYPHAVHKDMLRHRCMNRNVESFRAQPPEKLIEALRNGHAFKPDVFAKRTKGMGQSAKAIEEAKKASRIWDDHVHDVCEIAEDFLSMGIAKQQINFLLQDLCPLTEIITATDWSNFYALRTELKDDGTPMARPEVYKTAVAIQRALEASLPINLKHDQFHLPMVTDAELRELCRVRETKEASDTTISEAEQFWIGVSAGRCARISYGDFDWRQEDPAKSYERSKRLLESGHMSPFEQQAKPFSPQRWINIDLLQYDIRRSGMSLTDKSEMVRQLEYSGNLHGWVPARKMFKNEHDYGLMRKSS